MTQERTFMPDAPLTCGIPGCATTFPAREMASLMDKNGESWFVCPDCIDSMWARKPWTPDPAPIPGLSAELERVMMAFGEFIGATSVITGLLPPGVGRGALEKEIATARRNLHGNTDNV